MNTRGRQMAGYTIVEILTATVISAILITVLASIFNVATDRYNQGVGMVEGFTEARAGMELMQRDLGAAFSGRANDIDTPISAIAGGPMGVLSESGVRLDGSPGVIGDIVGTNPDFGGRLVVPFEVNRETGKIFDQGSGGSQDATKGIANATEGAFSNIHQHNYDAIAFVTRAPLARQGHTSVDRGEAFRSSEMSEDASLRSEGDACLAGYYVAYTKNAPIKGAGASMKLFRHFRDSGSSQSISSTDGSPMQSRSYHVIAEAMSRTRQIVESGSLENSELPILLTPVKKLGQIDIVHPWPESPAGKSGGLDYGALDKPPPLEVQETRDRTTEASELYLWGDAPLVFNILRFKCTPFRRLTNKETGDEYLAGAEEVNEELGINAATPEEWPVVVAPDVIRVQMKVIDDIAAAKFRSRDDWINWETIPQLKQLVRREGRDFETLIDVGQSR